MCTSVLYKLSSDTKVFNIYSIKKEVRESRYLKHSKYAVFHQRCSLASQPRKPT